MPRVRPHRLLVCALIAMGGLMLLPGLALASDLQAVCGTPLAKAMPTPFQVFTGGIPTGALAADLPQHDGRDPDFVFTLSSWDAAHPDTHHVAFWKEYTGLHADVYVGWNDLAALPESGYQDNEITPAQVAYLGKEFDENIWASNVFHFGRYEPRVPSSAPAGYDGMRAAIFVYNIRDEGYWGDYPSFIAGYYDPELNDGTPINAVFVDSYDWRNRIGPDVDNPYDYESTIAHEFEHLIHGDVDRDEVDFIDEGMAMLASQVLYGQVSSTYFFAEALAYHRDSLTDWDGELYDYGNSLMWQDYLWERAGGGDIDAPLAARIKPRTDPFAETTRKFADPGDALVWRLIHDQAHGLQGVANQVGGFSQVEKLHRDWTLANLLDGKVSESAWNYRNFALGGPDSDFYTIEDGIKYYAGVVGGNMPITRKNVWRSAATEPWGAYYRSFVGSAPGMTLTFEGPALDGVVPAAGAWEWYSGLGNMLDLTLTRPVTVTAGDTLTFMTWFDIEDQWDYGYVEASSNGSDWVKLQQISALPAATTDVFGSHAWDGPGGLTGSSNGWQRAEYSLGDLSGTVTIRFRYRTDEAANGAGWYVDDVRAGTYADDDTTAGWTTNGWQWTAGLQRNDWTADAYATYAKGSGRAYTVAPIVGIDSTSYAGSVYVSSQYQKQFPIIAVMSNRPEGVFSSTARLTVMKGR